MVHSSRMEIFNAVKETQVLTNISFKVGRHILTICSFLAVTLQQVGAAFLCATLLVVHATC